MSEILGLFMGMILVVPLLLLIGLGVILFEWVMKKLGYRYVCVISQGCYWEKKS